MSRCQQCGGVLKGYYQFRTCSSCYSKNVEAAQALKLSQEKAKEGTDVVHTTLQPKR